MDTVAFSSSGASVAQARSVRSSSLAYWSRKSTIERMEDDNAPKSNLAKDGPDHGDPDRLDPR